APGLALGTALVGTGYCLAGASAGFGLLVVALFVGGLGASAQHPLASSLMARAFAGPRSMKALGSYNFAGDIGKMTVPAAASLLLVAMSWRPALALPGGARPLAAAAVFGRAPPPPAPGPTAAAPPPPARRRAWRPAPLRVLAPALDRHARQRDPHGVSAVPAVRAHGQRREPADRRARADAGFRRRRGGQAHLRLRRRAHRSRRH